MSPEHGYNPFNSPDFRKEMSEMFDEKLGPVNQIQSNHEKRLGVLERWRWYLTGIFLAILGLAKVAAAALFGK